MTSINCYHSRKSPTFIYPSLKVIASSTNDDSARKDSISYIARYCSKK